MNQIIYIRRRSKIVLTAGSGATSIDVLATLQKNLETLGYQLTPEVIDVLKTSSLVQTDTFYRRLVMDLRTLVGAHRPFSPMYPNFPQQVMKMSEAELYINAIWHYWTLTRTPSKKEDRSPLDEPVKYRWIGLGSREEFESLFSLLARSKTPFSAQDKEDVHWFVSQYRDDIYRLLPEKIPSKENLASLGAELMRNTSAAQPFLKLHLKTATDVLRLAVAISNGDVSLATACKFGKFCRQERVLLLECVERAANRTEDMLRWRSRWVRLGERLHPGEYARRFPLSAEAFDVIRNRRPFVTLNREVERELTNRNVDRVLELLTPRPGDLARRLDHLSRISMHPETIVGRFREKAASVSTPVLLQVLTHFSHREDPADLRVFFPKGDVGNLFAARNPLPKLAPEISHELTAICERTLLGRFSQLSPLGKCYLDPRLKNYLVPFSQRSASKSLRTLVRGSRLPLPSCSTLRFFAWWKNGRGRVDIDLSAAMYDSNYGHIDTLAYYNLKNFGAYHSGDIVDAPKGAAEFIDIDLSKCLQQGVRYVVMCLNSFTAQAYCDLPECFAGWMARSRPNSGEIFEPRTVVDKVDLASDTRICLPAIFDLIGGQVYWTDIALTSYPRYANNVHNNLSGVSLMLRAMTQLKKTDLYSLFDLHIRARGDRVQSLSSSETVFSIEDGITPFDMDRIAAEFM